MTETMDDISACEVCEQRFCTNCDPSCPHAELCPDHATECTECGGEDRR